MNDREINKFIKAVTKDMGRKQRNEVKKELRAHILDSAEALAAERNVPMDDSIIKEVIQKMGSPGEIAAMYPAGKKRFLSDRVILAGISIFVIFFIIIIGTGILMAYQADHIQHREDATSHAGAGKISLDLENANGKIDVVESDTNDVEVIYDVTASEGHLNDVVTNTTYVRDGDTLKVKSRAEITSGFGFHIGYFDRHADALVKVPRGSRYQLYLTTSYGGVAVTALNGSSLIINNNNGMINVNGGNYDSISATTSWGKITAKYNATSATFSNSNGDIDIDSGQNGGSISATTTWGKITAKYGAADATFKNSNGDIDVSSSQNGGSISAITSWGKITAKYGAADATFKNSNGDIVIDSSQNGGSTSATTSWGKITAKYNATSATFSNSNGDIDLESGQNSGNIKAATSWGSVRVKLKEDALFSVDASVSFGQIVHDSFPIVQKEYSESRLIGYTEKGRGNLDMKLSASNGNVEINR